MGRRGIRLCVVAVTLLALGFLSGCYSARYIPKDGQLMRGVAPPAELKGLSYSYEPQHYSTLLPRANEVSHYLSDAARAERSVIDGTTNRELSTWFAASGDDLQVSLITGRGKPKLHVPSTIAYFLTLSIFPGLTDTSNYSKLQVSSGGQVLYTHTEEFDIRLATSVILPTAYLYGMAGTTVAGVATSDQLQRHKLALGQFIAEKKGDYEEKVAAGTVQTYRDFLKNNPHSFYRIETLRRLAALEPSRNALAFHRANLELDPSYRAYIPEQSAVWFVGPADMPVYEVLQMAKREKDNLVAARIKVAGKPYKNFSDEEVSTLKKGGMPSDLIVAMLEVTAAQQNSAGASLAGAALGSNAAPASFAQPAGSSASTPAAQPQGAGDIAAQCAKRLAAIKACDQLPSFAGKICRNKAKQKFSHLACELIQ